MNKVRYTTWTQAHLFATWLCAPCGAVWAELIEDVERAPVRSCPRCRALDAWYCGTRLLSGSPPKLKAINKKGKS